MATIKRFEDLELWQLARQQCIDVENLVKEGLWKYNIRLKDQIQGSSGSVMDNIAEGFEKENTKEFINYLYHSKGFNGEVRSQLIRIMDFNYLEPERMQKLVSKAIIISSKLKLFINYLQKVEYRGQRYANDPAVSYSIEIEGDFFDAVETCQNVVNKTFEQDQIQSNNYDQFQIN